MWKMSRRSLIFRGNVEEVQSGNQMKDKIPELDWPPARAEAIVNPEHRMYFSEGPKTIYSKLRRHPVLRVMADVFIAVYFTRVL